MATFNILTQTLERGRPADWRAMVVSYKGPTSYAAGGDLLTPANLGLSEILFMDLTGASGYICEFDYTNNKVKFYRDPGSPTHTHITEQAAAYTQNEVSAAASAVQAAGALTEVAAAVNLSAVVLRILIFGR